MELTLSTDQELKYFHDLMKHSYKFANWTLADAILRENSARCGKDGGSGERGKNDEKFEIVVKKTVVVGNDNYYNGGGGGDGNGQSTTNNNNNNNNNAIGVVVDSRGELEWRRKFDGWLLALSPKNRMKPPNRKIHTNYVTRLERMALFDDGILAEKYSRKNERLLRKFALSQEEDGGEKKLLCNLTGKIVLCLEDVFGAIHKCHWKAGHNPTETFMEVKKSFGNISSQMIAQYLKGCKICNRHEETAGGGEEQAQSSSTKCDAAAAWKDASDSLWYKRNIFEIMENSKYRDYVDVVDNSIVCRFCPFTLESGLFLEGMQIYYKMRYHLRSNHQLSATSQMMMAIDREK